MRCIMCAVLAIRVLAISPDAFAAGSDKATTQTPPVCLIAQQDLDEAITPRLPLEEPKVQPLPLASVGSSRSIDGIPQLRQDPDALNTRDGVADAVINGKDVRLVFVHEPGMCPAVGFEIWTPNFAKRLYASDLDSHSAAMDEDLASYGGRSYLVVRSDGPLPTFRLSEFMPRTKPRLLCELTPVATTPEDIEQAKDPALCNAVVQGQVEAVPMETTEPVTIDADLLGTDVAKDMGASEGWTYTMKDKASVDLFNDGHPVRMGTVDGYRQMGGCGKDEKFEWPVLLDAHDLPDPALTQISAGGDRASLIRFHGAIYLDGGASLGSNFPYHVVYKMTRKGSAAMCVFRTTHYEVKPQPETKGSDDPA